MGGAHPTNHEGRMPAGSTWQPCGFEPHPVRSRAGRQLSPRSSPFALNDQRPAGEQPVDRHARRMPKELHVNPALLREQSGFEPRPSGRKPGGGGTGRRTGVVSSKLSSSCADHPATANAGGTTGLISPRRGFESRRPNWPREGRGFGPSSSGLGRGGSTNRSSRRRRNITGTRPSHSGLATRGFDPRRPPCMTNARRNYIDPGAPRGVRVQTPPADLQVGSGETGKRARKAARPVFSSPLVVVR